MKSEAKVEDDDNDNDNDGNGEEEEGEEEVFDSFNYRRIFRARSRCFRVCLLPIVVYICCYLVRVALLLFLLHWCHGSHCCCLHTVHYVYKTRNYELIFHLDYKSVQMEAFSILYAACQFVSGWVDVSVFLHGFSSE